MRNSFVVEPILNAARKRTTHGKGIIHLNSVFADFADELNEPGEGEWYGLKLTGRVVDAYHVECLLADQAACEVYKALDIRLKRPAALKVLKRTDIPGTATSRRFRLEAEILANLRHPNILQLYGMHEIDGQPCMALEFIDRGTLADALEENGPLQVDAALQVLLRVARAVGTAHRMNVIHRDLKPHNILIDSSIVEPAIDTPLGFIKVADFGIARFMNRNQSLTSTGTQPGTASFMAPEQAEARNQEICKATDIFSLGAILYTMLVGVSPFDAPNIVLSLQKIIEGPVPRLSAGCPAVPKWLEDIYDRCMKWNPAERYPDADELAFDLYANMTDSSAVPARPSASFIMFLIAGGSLLMAITWRLLLR
jgi:serine/threonine protein kinase